MLTRRLLLASAAPIALAGCGGATTSTFNLPLALQKAQAIDTAMSDVLTSISSLSIPGLTASILDTVQAALAGFKAVVVSLAKVATQAAAGPLYAQIEAYVKAFATPLLALVGVPPALQMAITVAVDLLPVLQAALVG